MPVSDLNSTEHVRFVPVRTTVRCGADHGWLQSLHKSHTAAALFNSCPLALVCEMRPSLVLLIVPNFRLFYLFESTSKLGQDTGSSSVPTIRVWVRAAATRTSRCMHVIAWKKQRHYCLKFTGKKQNIKGTAIMFRVRKLRNI